MKIKLNEMQQSAVKRVMARYKAGKRRITLIGPPGAGKTEVIKAIISKFPGKVLVIAHKRDLTRQTAERIAQDYAPDEVGVRMAGAEGAHNARIVIGTIQTMRKVGRLTYDLVVLDEAHHYAADDWRKITKQLRGKPCLLGATATPERSDGTPLNDLFEEFVQVGTYKELIKAKRLVPEHVCRPAQDVGNMWAQNPIDAYERNGGGSAIIFLPSIAQCEHYSDELWKRGISSAAITSETPQGKRSAAIRNFKEGVLQVLLCVNTLVEGMDFTNCRMVILAKPFIHRSTYVQACGRALRAGYLMEGGVRTSKKTHGIIVDLTSAYLRHGPPTHDVKYTLDGRPVNHTGDTGPRSVNDDREKKSAEDPPVANDPMVNHADPPIVLPDPNPKLVKALQEEYAQFVADCGKYGRRLATEKSKGRTAKLRKTFGERILDLLPVAPKAEYDDNRERVA